MPAALRTRARTLASAALPPLAAFALSIAVFVHVARMDKVDLFAGAIWSRWDAAQYIGIASRGYQLFRCGLEWCGNCAWFPGFPWLIAALTRLRFNPVVAGVTISWLFHLGTLWILWNQFLKRAVTLDSVIVLLFATFFPGFVFHLAVFPLSMLAFFTMLSLHLAVEERWLASGLAGAVAALSYSTGFVLALVLTIWICIEHRPTSVRALPTLARRLALAPGLVVLGFVAVLAVQRATVGVWSAFFETQAHYGHGIHNPMVAVVHHVNLAVTSEKHPIVSIQLLLFIAIALAMVHGTAARGRLGRRLDSLLVVFLLVYWPLPFLVGGMVTNRSESPLLPCALLLGNLPRTLQVFVLVVTILIDYEMVGLFYQGNLI